MREKRGEERARQPLTRFVYICTYCIRYEVWLSHAFKFVCRDGARRPLMPSSYTIRRQNIISFTSMTHTRRRDTRGLEYDSLDSDLNSIIDSTQRRSFPRRFYQKLRGSLGKDPDISRPISLGTNVKKKRIIITLILLIIIIIDDEISAMENRFRW